MTKQKRKVYRLNDFFFKNLMGDEKRSNLTLRFLNLILNRTGEDAFKSIQFLKTEQDPLTKDGKLSILDVKASVDDKPFVNIELQVSRQNYIVERSMFYISRIFSEQAVSFCIRCIGQHRVFGCHCQDRVVGIRTHTAEKVSSFPIKILRAAKLEPGTRDITQNRTVHTAPSFQQPGAKARHFPFCAQKPSVYPLLAPPLRIAIFPDVVVKRSCARPFP